MFSAQIKQQTEARDIRLLRLPHPRTGRWFISELDIPSVLLLMLFLQGLSSLFVPYQTGEQERAQNGSILEIQVVSPMNGRSWFLGKDEVVASELSYLFPDPLAAHEVL